MSQLQIFSVNFTDPGRIQRASPHCAWPTCCLLDSFPYRGDSHDHIDDLPDHLPDCRPCRYSGLFVIKIWRRGYPRKPASRQCDPVAIARIEFREKAEGLGLLISREGKYFGPKPGDPV